MGGGEVKERPHWLNKILIARNQTHPASLKFKHLFGVCEVYTSHKLFRLLSLWRAAGQRATPVEFPNHRQRQQPSGLALPTAAIVSRQVSRSRSAVLLLLLLFTLLLLQARSRRHWILQCFTSRFTSMFLFLMSDCTRPGQSLVVVFFFSSLSLHSLFFLFSFF